MGITAGDIDFELTGGSGETNPDNSLGGAKSGTTITSAQDNNLFDDVSGDEASSGDTEYRGIAIVNEDASEDWLNVVCWITSETPSTDTQIDIWPETPSTDSIQTIANESTAPGGASFTHPTSKGTGVDLTSEGESTGTVAHTEWCGLWLRRVVQSSASGYSGDTVTIRAEGETVGCPPGAPPGTYLLFKEIDLNPITGKVLDVRQGYVVDENGEYVRVDSQ